MSALHLEMLLISIKVTLQCGKDLTALSYVTLKRLSVTPGRRRRRLRKAVWVDTPRP